MGQNYIKECKNICSLPRFPSNDICEFSKEEEEILNKNIKNKRNKNINKKNKKYIIISPQRLLTISKPIYFIDNDVGVALNLLISSIIYEKMLNNESLNEILNPLQIFTNENLFEIIESLIIIINELIVYDHNQKLHDLFYDILKEIIGTKLNGNNITLENDVNVNNILMNIVENLVEIYHYFKYDTAKEKYPYKFFFWNNQINIIEYIKENINDIKNNLNKIDMIKK